MAGMAGWLFGMYYGRAVFYMGLIPGLKAFTACVIGGMGSIPGAMVGSIIMGELEVLSGAYVSLDYKDAFSLGALFIILILRPNGLFGGRDVARRV
jgi:branched-chain amino acid transport system permease protein